MRNITFNLWDYIIIVIIISLTTGVIGGALQLTRIISLFLILPNLYFLLINKFPSILLLYLFIGFIWIISGYVLLNPRIVIYHSLPELIYLFLYLNIMLSLVISSQKAVSPIESILNGWLIFFMIALPIGLMECFSNIHFSTNSIQSASLEVGGAINGVINKRYAAFFFNNYNEFMTCLSFGMPFLFCSLFLYENLRRQLLIWCLIMISGIIFLITASRGAILCYFICLFIVISYYKKVKFRNKKRLIRVLIIVGILGSALSSGILLNDLNARFSQNSTNVLEDVGRIEIYLKSWNVFKDTHYIGTGPFGLQHILGYATHNLWLEILCQYGWFVFIPVSFSMFYLYKKGFRLSKKVLGIRLCLIMSLCNIIPISVINSGYLIFSFFWVSVGCIITMIHYMIFNKKYDLEIKENYCHYT